MSKQPQYYIVEASALPEVFLKVAETKRLLSTGEAGTVNEATRMTDISRSAFYKYRDAVMPFQNMMMGRIVTIQLLLHDEAGLLSDILQFHCTHKRHRCCDHLRRNHGSDHFPGGPDRKAERYPRRDQGQCIGGLTYPPIEGCS